MRDQDTSRIGEGNHADVAELLSELLAIKTLIVETDPLVLPLHCNSNAPQNPAADKAYERVCA